MLPVPVVIRVTSTAQNLGARGVGFRLEPLHNAVTGNPVAMSATVRLNRNDALTIPLSDDAPRYFGEAFEVLELIGGRTDDLWLVTIYESQADGVGAPARILQPSNVIAKKKGFTAAESALSSTFWVPNANGLVQASSQTRAVPFDVTGFSSVLVSATCGLKADPAFPANMPMMRLIVEAAAGPDADAPENGTITMDLGGTGSGLLRIGGDEGTFLEESNENGVSRRYAWLRVGYQFFYSGAGSPTLQPNNTSSLYVVGLR